MGCRLLSKVRWRQGEIKGPPSLGAYVVGLVEAFAPSRKWCRRRLRRNPLEYQCRECWHGHRRWRARPIERLNPAARPSGCGCAAGVDPLARPRCWCGMVAVATRSRLRHRYANRATHRLLGPSGSLLTCDKGVAVLPRKVGGVHNHLPPIRVSGPHEADTGIPQGRLA